MDASTATAATTAASNLFNMDQKFDLANLLRNIAAASAASTTVTSSSGTTNRPPISSTATSPNSVESSSSTNGPAATSGTPSPPHGHHAELKPIPASSLAPPGVVQRRQLSFSPIQPVYAPSGHGRQILIYDSRSHPGRRREFAYKTRFTNQSGLTTVYYRCMACRALRHRLQRSLPKEKLPAVPCIAVKNDLLINDPDFPDASDHFCTPLTIDESNQRLRNTFERGHKRARMKMANSTVEETIRKVGRIRGAEAEAMGADDGDLELGLAADGSTSSAGMIDLNGTLDGSDCSSDWVDVLKEESPDEDLMDEAESGYSPATTEKPSSEGDDEHHHQNHQLELEDHQKKSPAEKKQSTAGEPMFNTPTGGKSSPLAASNSSTPIGGFLGSSTTRSPRKKLDSLLKMAEMRAAAAAANGDANKTNRNNAQEGKINGKQQQQHSTAAAEHHQPAPMQRETSTAQTPTAMPNPLPIQLSNFLSATGQFQQLRQIRQSNSTPQNNTNVNNVPASVQNIHAIAARLSRGGTNAASELTKALAGMKGHQQQQTPTQQNQQQHQQQEHHQKCSNAAAAIFMNGGEKTVVVPPGNMQQQFSMLNGGNTAQIPPTMGLQIAELLKKYVENNLELTPETAGNARSAGELACALFMAQMVENVELRQEVQKLRCELDSLKALVAAAAVLQTNNNNGSSNGHLHNQQHHHH